MADYSTEYSASNNVLYIRPADGMQRSTQFGEAEANTHQFTGSVYVSGAIFANEYRVSQIDTSQGSTIFGNSSGDTHRFTGSLAVSTTLIVTGDTTLKGASTLKGNTIVGDSASEKHQITGSLYAGGIITAQNTVSSSAKGVFLQGVESAGNLNVSGNVSFGSQGSALKVVPGSGMSPNAAFITGNVYIGDNNTITFGANNDATIRYDEASTDRFVVVGNTTFSNDVNIDGSTIIGNASADNHILSGTVYAPGLTASANVVTTSRLTASQGAMFPDNVKVRFGSDSDAIVKWSTGLGAVNISNNVLIDDDKSLFFGGSGDGSIVYDENTTDALIITGNKLKLLSKAPGMFGSNMPLQVTASAVHFGDDTKVYFGANNDAHIEYDENGTNKLTIAGNTVFSNNVSLSGEVSGSGRAIFVGNLTTAGALNVTGSSTLAGSATVMGDVSGSARGIFVGNVITAGTLSVSGSTTLAGPEAIKITPPPDDGASLTEITGNVAINHNGSAGGTLVINPPSSYNTGKVALEVHYTGSTNPVHLSNDTGGGEVVYFGSGSAAAGALHYLNTGGGWEKANASAVGNQGASGAGNAALLGIPLGTNPSIHGVLIKGFFDANTDFTGTFEKGKAVYVHTTAGKMTTTAPNSSNNYVRIIGYATNTPNVIFLNPDSTWVVID
jgi:cytoskeletal protein CcmA (bactofilin family)